MNAALRESRRQPVFDSVTDAALLLAITMPVGVVTLFTMSYWPLAAGALPLAIAVLRRRAVAFALVAALLAVCALVVSVSRSLG